MFGILLAGVFTSAASADQIRFPLVMDAHYAPAIVLTKTVKDNSGFRFEQCQLDFRRAPGPIDHTLYDAINAPEAKCWSVNDAWRSMSDETSNDAFTKELEGRIAEHVKRLNSRVRTNYLLDILASGALVGLAPLNMPWLGSTVSTIVGLAGVVGLVRSIPAYAHYKPFTVSDVVADRLAALDPSSDELRVTSKHVYRAIIHALRETLAEFPAAIPSTPTAPAEPSAPAPTPPEVSPAPSEPAPTETAPPEVAPPVITLPPPAVSSAG